MMATVIHKSTLKTGGLLLAILGIGLSLLAWPQAVGGGISRGLSICSTVIIPALFPFMVVAGFLTRSGLSRALGRRLEKVTQLLFGLPGCCAAAILIGFVGGYPAGGLAIGELIEQGDLTPLQGRRMLRFCVNAGPAFVISAVGAGLMGSTHYGVVLFAAHITASLLLGIVGRALNGRHSIATAACTPKKTAANLPLSTAFVQSVNAASRSLLYMCGFVVLFAAGLALADVSGLSRFCHYLFTLPFALIGMDTAAIPSLLAGLLEVSCGCVDVAAAGTAAPFLLGWIMGWGGLSVHCQLAATLHEYRLIDKSFFLARLLHGLLGGVFSLILFRLVPLPLHVFNPLSEAVLTPFSTSAAASAAMLMMCAMFILSLSKSKNI